MKFPAPFILAANQVVDLFFGQSSVDRYIQSQTPIAQASLLANIGRDGEKSQGAKAGVVIASPSTHDPDYLYTWTRDSALVFKLLIETYTSGHDGSLRNLIDDFVTSQGRIQFVENPSGNIRTGGLGEPKFNIDETSFTLDWGRPQRDGPALRAIAIIIYANWLVDNGNATHVEDSLWPIIEIDLDYVAKTWNHTTFDLWEEVHSSSYYTAAVQHRSLRQGAKLAETLRKSEIASIYEGQADRLLCFMQTFWNNEFNYMTANTGGGRTGIDANPGLASIHTFDASAGCDASTFQPCSDKALANLLIYVDAFRGIYDINSDVPAGEPVATGRYPEDCYYSGNAWHLTTLAVAEQLYDALIVWKAQGYLEITPISQPFFALFNSSILPGVFDNSKNSPSAPIFAALTSGIRSFADGFVEKVAEYTLPDGELPEQYSRENGTAVSARHLTWSYAAALSTFSARSGYVPKSWGARESILPDSCTVSTNSANSGEAKKTEITITFTVRSQTNLGEDIFVTGSTPSLGNWDPAKAIPLRTTECNPSIWFGMAKLPAGTDVEYKYIRKHGDKVDWQSGENGKITTPVTGTLVQKDSW